MKISRLQYGAVLPATNPIGFSNDFMACRRGTLNRVY